MQGSTEVFILNSIEVESAWQDWLLHTGLPSVVEVEEGVDDDVAVVVDHGVGVGVDDGVGVGVDDDIRVGV